jgi:hypothetical protein
VLQRNPSDFFFIPSFHSKRKKKVEGRIDNPEKIKTTKEISRPSEGRKLVFFSFFLCLPYASNA